MASAALEERRVGYERTMWGKLGLAAQPTGLHRGERRATLSKTARETEAEAVAFVVSHAIGLTGAVNAAADYIQLYAGEAKTLAESLDHIQKTAADRSRNDKRVARAKVPVDADRSRCSHYLSNSHGTSGGRGVTVSPRA